LALQNEEFVLHYQPQIDLSTGRICGAEALIRWKRPSADPVFPDRFIPLAEETGLIHDIGDWVLSEACRQILNWQRLGADSVRVAVNMSGRQLQEADVVESVRRVLERTAIDPALLELEITESTLMQEGDEAVKVLHRLKAMGLSISIDDFGTGYSSLSYLKRLPIDRLKIDRSFIMNVTTDPDDEAIVKAIMAVAHSLKLKVIAEGVETQQTLQFLKSHNCDEAQGYLFSRPVPPDQFAQILWKEKNSNSGDLSGH
jgi:EAL domain-containing protein (putative c-di-GMP-specific phosphodiesterase class I)